MKHKASEQRVPSFNHADLARLLRSDRGSFVEVATDMLERADYAFAMMALALAKISVHEANADTEDAIIYTRNRMKAQFPSIN
ncbi:MAG TPA: hypothetical protein VGN98_13510 [Tianweitania sediminis]|nr:hypothetical protein [Tianweitania sediminis]